MCVCRLGYGLNRLLLPLSGSSYLYNLLSHVIYIPVHLQLWIISFPSTLMYFLTGEHPAAMSHNAASLPTTTSNSFSSHFRTLSFAIWLLLVALIRKLLTSSSLCALPLFPTASSTTSSVHQKQPCNTTRVQQQHHYQSKQVKQFSQVKGRVVVGVVSEQSNNTSNCCNHKNGNSSNIQKCHHQRWRRSHEQLQHETKAERRVKEQKQQVQQEQNCCTKVVIPSLTVKVSPDNGCGKSACNSSSSNSNNTSNYSHGRNDKCSYSNSNELHYRQRRLYHDHHHHLKNYYSSTEGCYTGKSDAGGTGVNDCSVAHR